MPFLAEYPLDDQAGVSVVDETERRGGFPQALAQVPET